MKCLTAEENQDDLYVTPQPTDDGLYEDVYHYTVSPLHRRITSSYPSRLRHVLISAYQAEESAGGQGLSARALYDYQAGAYSHFILSAGGSTEVPSTGLMRTMRSLRALFLVPSCTC